MICNGTKLLDYAPIKDMHTTKHHQFGVSSGLGEAGYDIRIKQSVIFDPILNGQRQMTVRLGGDPLSYEGRFIIASAMEEFQMPDDLVGIVHDKSTWARKGLSVFNTVIEPGWNGFLTLELVYHGHAKLIIPAGAGIAQVIFHFTSNRARYEGKYQNQEDRPVQARKA